MHSFEKRAFKALRNRWGSRDTVIPSGEGRQRSGRSSQSRDLLFAYSADAASVQQVPPLAS